MRHGISAIVLCGGETAYLHETQNARIMKIIFSNTRDKMRSRAKVLSL